MENTQKLPIRIKFAMAYGDFGKSTLNILNAFFLLWFYTDVAKIPAAAATVIMMIAKVWDAINDPMMGIILDKTISKEGKCRAWLKYLSVPAGICVALSYYAPHLQQNHLIVFVAITYLFQGMAQTATNVPFNTLLARITTDKDERVKLGQWRGYGNTLASVLVTAIALPFVNWIGHGDQTKGFFTFAIICGVIYATSFLTVWAASKGFEEPSIKLDKNSLSEIEKAEAEKQSVGAILKALFSNKYALFVCFVNILFMIYNALNGASMVYYLQYNLHNTNLMSVYSTMSSIISFIAILGMGYMGKKFGNALCCSMSSVALVISFGLRFFTHDANLPILFFCWGCEGIGTGLFAQMIYQCALDSMTYGEWKSGVDNGGTIMSIFTFAQKAGLAGGGILASWLLTVFNYKASATEQSQTIQNLFFAEIVTIPLVIFIILVFAFLRLNKLEKQLPQMQAEIDARKAAEAEALGVTEHVAGEEIKEAPVTGATAATPAEEVLEIAEAEELSKDE